MQSYLGIFGRSVCFFNAKRNFALGQSGHLEHHLSHSRTQIDKFIFGADWMQLIKDLTNKFEAGFAVNFRRKSFVMIEQIGIGDTFVVGALQNMLQKWTSASVFKIRIWLGSSLFLKKSILYLVIFDRFFKNLPCWLNIFPRLCCSYGKVTP